MATALPEIFEKVYIVTEADTVKIYDHVHHAQSFYMLERARLDYLESIGFPDKYFFERDLLLVIYSISATYKREIKKGQVKITCQDVKLSEDRRSLYMTQIFYNQRGKEAIVASVHSMCMHAKRRRAVRFPEEFSALFIG
ncbi:MAG: hypothetical protein D6719_07790 [Candidatus Dadabacteria bacterium]|nr:MAG: hypothetical protein D6719_07790 [Candidatus Dadabacteria bacterium]